MELEEQISDAIHQGVPKQDVQILINERDKVQYIIDEVEPFAWQPAYGRVLLTNWRQGQTANKGKEHV